MMPNQPSTTPTPTSGATRRSGRLIAFGVVVLVGLLVAAGALWLAGENRRADNVASFARAPVGCDTTLDFERSGTFVLFIETTGRIGELAGECNAALDYDTDADDDLAEQLAPGLLLTGPDGTVLPIVDAPGGGYDLDGFVGTAAWSVDIDTPGDHVLSVASTGGDPIAIAVGRSVDEGVALLRWGAVASAVVALVLGGGLLVSGSRHVTLAQPSPVPWVPDGPGWPSSPPGFPEPPPTTGAVGPPRTSPSGAAPIEQPPPPPPPAPAPPPRSPWEPPGSASDVR
jgi:hypothetical protein